VKNYLRYNPKAVSLLQRFYLPVCSFSMACPLVSTEAYERRLGFSTGSTENLNCFFGVIVDSAIINKETDKQTNKQQQQYFNSSTFLQYHEQIKSLLYPMHSALKAKILY